MNNPSAAQTSASIRKAFQFLTTLPMPSQGLEDVTLAESSRFFPLVGLVIGCFTYLVYWLGNMVFPPLVTSVLVCAAWIILTGGLHLDGLADCCDSLFCPADKKRRLEILKDSRLGTFGAAGLIIVILLKIAAISNLTEFPVVIFLAPSLARWVILLAKGQPVPDYQGMGSSFISGLKPRDLIVGLLIPLILLLYAGAAGVIALIASILTAVICFFLARRRLGGVNGDILGMVIEISETVVLLITITPINRFFPPFLPS